MIPSSRELILLLLENLALLELVDALLVLFAITTLFDVKSVTHLVQLGINLTIIVNFLSLLSISFHILLLFRIVHLLDQDKLVGLLFLLSPIKFIFCDVFEHVRWLHMLNFSLLWRIACSHGVRGGILVKLLLLGNSSSVFLLLNAAILLRLA